MKSTRRRIVSPEEILKQVMLELLYPAVLGSVLLFFLEVTDRAVNSLAMWRSPHVSFDQMTTLKWLLLLMTATFYCCDYVYIILTRAFQIKFFKYDCVFLLGLYVTLASLKVREVEMRAAPATWVIATVYAAFFLMYRKWDKFELHHSEDPKEQLFYTDVIRWETWSFWLLLPTIPVALFFREATWPGLVILIILSISTSRFFQLVKRKRLFATA